MIEKIIYTLLIFSVSYFFNRLLHAKNNYPKVTILIFIMLMIAVIGSYSSYVLVDVISEKEYAEAMGKVGSVFMFFVIIVMIYGVILAILASFYKEPKKEKWEFKETDNQERLNSKAPVEKIVTSKGIDISFYQFSYTNFFIFTQKDLPVFLVVIFQLTIIWRPDFFADNIDSLIRFAPIKK